MNKNTLNPFDEFSSKVKRIYIPLPNYKYFHKPTTDGSVDSHFVGRERMIDTLKEWLGSETKKANPNGSYLITGYRGMGKSSVVGKAIDEVMCTKSKAKRKHETQKAKHERKHKIWVEYLRPTLDTIALLCILFSPVIFGFIPLVVLGDWINSSLFWTILAWSGKILAVALVSYLLVRIVRRPRNYVLSVTLSIGDEISSERDILARIADAMRMRFENYTRKEYPSRGTSLARKALSMGVIAVAWSVFFSTKWLKNAEWIAYIAYIPLAVLLYFLAMKLGRYVLDIFGWSYRFVSARQVLAKLNDCCDRINATVGEETETDSSIKNESYGGVSFRRRRSKNYPFASTQEIEQELMRIIEIFSDSWVMRARVIIVLDELDKLVVHSNKNNETKSDLPEFAHANSGFPGSSSYRVRKQNLLYTLAQLKYFISNAKAKFVFIAGRELFDAFKEDVSDREFSISSIFNGILNVDSFFSYDSTTKEITRMTERYLCKQLFPDGKDREDDKGIPKDEGEEIDEAKTYKGLTLRNYYESILSKSEITDKEKRGTVVFLKHFVSYLTFISNGAPKKITNQFERYVVSKQKHGDEVKKYPGEFIDIKFEGQGEPEYYLAFGYYDQQKINFIHYMVDPVFRNIISPASEYGDKLLVSASFLLGHIYKHHNSGFSMQNLEYMPELIENTRTPELREFIGAIMAFLEQNHITQVPTGLYEYKFHMKLYEEIAVFSKKSEQVSAIFNFSRDYSLSVKQYFSDVLKYYEERTETTPIVLANIHHYLGDLYMSSEEYSEAINHYRITKNLIIEEFEGQGGSLKDKNATLIARLTRVMLKMGLAYEKRHTIDSAYLTYNELVNILISNRFVDDEKFGLDYRLEKTHSWEGGRILIFPNRYSSYSSRDEFNRKIRPEFVSPCEENPSYWAYNDELTEKLSYHLSEETSALISKLSLYEDLRVAYTPLLAKLFSVEKQNVGGITLTNIAVTEAEFRHLFLLTNNKQKYILSADFFRKLGDIFYYKHSDFKRNGEKLYTLLDLWDYNLVKDVTDYCYHNNIPKQLAEDFIKHIKNISIDNALKKIKSEREFTVWYGRNLWKKLEKIENRTKGTDLEDICLKFLKDTSFNRLPKHYAAKRIKTIEACVERQSQACHACKYYNRSLYILAKNIIPDKLFKKHEDLSKGVLFLIATRYNGYNFREKELFQIALSLEAMGHVLLSCHKGDDHLSEDFLKILIPLLELDPLQSRIGFYKWGIECVKSVKNIKDGLNPLEKSLVYYFAAAAYYEKAGKEKQAAQSYVKVFHLVSMYVSTHMAKFDGEFKEFIKLLEKKILPHAIRSVQSTLDHSALIEFSSGVSSKKIPMDIASNMPDVEEIVLAFCDIGIEMESKGYEKIPEERLKRFYNSHSLSNPRLDSLTYNRIISLLFKANLNKLLLRRLFKAVGKTTTGCAEVLNETFKDCYTDMFGKIKNSVFGKEATEAELLEFLITDSIFCLSNIVEYISPTFRTTMFTNGFCGDVYKELLEWEKIKELYQEDTEGEDAFKNYFDQKINKISRDSLRKTYLAEMALKYYRKAKEMNSEGQAYQDFIAGMTVVDDDLHNDICQFHLAQERFHLRNGDIDKKIKQIENHAKEVAEKLSKSKCYRMERYFGEEQ